MDKIVQDALDIAEMGLMVGETREDVLSVIYEKFGKKIAVEVDCLLYIKDKQNNDHDD